MSEGEFASYCARLEREVFDYMLECEEKTQHFFTHVIAHHSFVNPMVSCLFFFGTSRFTLADAWSTMHACPALIASLSKKKLARAMAILVFLEHAISTLLYFWNMRCLLSFSSDNLTFLKKM